MLQCDIMIRYLSTFCALVLAVVPFACTRSKLSKVTAERAIRAFLNDGVSELSYPYNCLVESGILRPGANSDNSKFPPLTSLGTELFSLPFWYTFDRNVVELHPNSKDYRDRWTLVRIVEISARDIDPPIRISNGHSYSVITGDAEVKVIQRYHSATIPGMKCPTKAAEDLPNTICLMGFDNGDWTQAPCGFKKQFGR